MIFLGSKVSCKITGFTGIAISYIVYKNKCVRVSVLPKVDKDRKMMDEVWFDVQDLVSIGSVKKEKVEDLLIIPLSDNGGSNRSTPPPMNTP